MSVCYLIKTRKKLVGKDILKSLANKGEKLCATSDEFPYVKFGIHQKSLRGIEVNKERGGYEVRVCAFANQEDYRIFKETIKMIAESTGGRVYGSDDEQIDIKQIDSILDAKWVEDERESSYMITRTLSIKSGEKIVLDGMFRDICFGPHLLEELDIPLYGEYNRKDMDRLQDYLVSVQWEFADKKDTRIGMALPDPDDQEHLLGISMITIKNGNVSDFDFISYAPIFGIVDTDHQDIPPVLVPFEQVGKIVDQEAFRRIDEYQYERTDVLTADMVHDMMDRARLFQTDNLHKEAMLPGEGFDDKQRTFILMWNPGISSVKLADHNSSVSRMCTEYFNWSVWDYEKARIGDRFFLVRVGDGNTGIVMSGVFSSAPWEAEDWSGRGRRTFYMDMTPNCIINPEDAPIVTTEELTRLIPDFDWSGGHSGRLLSSDAAQKLETYWAEFIRKHSDDIDHTTFNAYYTERI